MNQLDDLLQKKFEAWMLEHENELQRRWDTYISEMQDSVAHKRYVYHSDKCFEEWAYEIYENERTFTKPVQTIKEWKDE